MPRRRRRQIDTRSYKERAEAASQRPAPTDTNARKSLKNPRPNAVSRLVNHWLDRLVGAVDDRTFAEQEELYESGSTKKDYILNSIGLGIWGMTFPLLTIIVTQLAGVEKAGVFSLAFVTATLLMYLANYGVRTYQVSDLEERYSFADYRVHRILTCVIMMVVGIVYCKIRGYGDEMFTVSVGVYLFRMIDALADVYEGRLQQTDKMYLGGISQAVRGVLCIVVFAIALFITGSIAVASIVFGVAAVASFFVVTLPLALMETPKSRKLDFSSVVELFKRCFPLFLALFLYSVIDNMPKFLMEGTLAYENQLYFNALYFPSHAIALVMGLVYKPLILRLANAWEEPGDNSKFNKIIAVVFAIIVGVVVVMYIIMGTIGLPIISFLYGVDFEQFRGLLYMMIFTGGVTASIDFLYQVITVQRRQDTVTRLYLITFVVSILVSLLLINAIGLAGAVGAYLIEMLVLLGLIVMQIAKTKKATYRI